MTLSKTEQGAKDLILMMMDKLGVESMEFTFENLVSAVGGIESTYNPDKMTLTVTRTKKPKPVMRRKQDD